MLLKPVSATVKLINNSKFITNIKHLHVTSKYEAIVAFNLSDIGEGIREVIVKEWFVKVGDKVSQFEDICEVQSDKASVTITSRYDGIVQKLYYKVDEIALVGKPLIDIETENNEITDESQATSNSPPEKYIEKEQNKSEDIIKEPNINICLPSVRRLAKENNIDLSLIKGTGKNNRILKEDVLKYLTNQQQHEEKSNAVGGDHIEPLTSFQKTMVKTMTESLKIPHLVYGDEINVTKLTKLRKQIIQSLENKDLKISYMPFIIKAVSNALKSYPILNAKLCSSNENLIFQNEHNIGIAMDTDLGLAVPVVKNVESLSVFEINDNLHKLVKSGRKGQFLPQDLSGGTFTISNIGSIGGTYLKPVIMPPQSCLLALGTIRLLPRFNEFKEISVEEIINISAAADHRIIDGATMARFVEVLKKQLQDPLLIFLGL